MFSKANNHLTEGSILKALLYLAGPIMLANVLQAAYQLIDSFWVGRLGENAVAAVAVSIPIVFLLTSLGIGFAIAGATFVAQYFGAKNEKMISHAAAQTTLMIIVVSIILSFIGFLFSNKILNLMGVEKDLMSTASIYLKVVFLGLLPNFCFMMFQSIMRSIGRPQVPVLIVLITVALNFLLDPLLMFGFGPIPKMGVAGVAYATIITQSIAALIGLITLFSGKHGIHLKISDFKPDFSFIKKSFWLGLPASIEQSARSLGMVVMAGLITGFGTAAVASYGAGSNIIQLVIIISIGLASATAALSGQNIGAGKYDRAEKITKLSAKISFIGLTLVGGLVFLSAPLLIKFFIPNNLEIITGGSHFLKIVAFNFGLIGIQMSINAVLQASGNTLTSMFLTISSQWFIQLPLAFILSRFTSLGLNGLWLAFPLTNIIMTFIALGIFKSGYWKKKKITDAEKIAITVSENIEKSEVVPYDA